MDLWLDGTPQPVVEANPNAVCNATADATHRPGARRANRHGVFTLFLCLILSSHAILLALSAWRHSPVLNETGHLPAGISHWRFERFDLYRVNPPLVRMVAAAAVMLFGDPRLNWQNYSDDPLVRGESAVAIDFVHANGPGTFWLYTVGRWACIPFSLAGALACFFWARDLYDNASGFVALCLWCFCPIILGNGSLIMPDVPCAALGAAAAYSYWWWLKRPNWRTAILAGMVLGAAQLTKTTLLVFYLTWPLIWIVFRTVARPCASRAPWRREGAMLALLLVVSLYCINLGYFFEGSFQRLGDYRFQSRLFAGMPDSRHAGEVGNRFDSTWIALVPIPLPRNYVQGIDAQKRDFERGMKSYLRGQWSDQGWWYYYLYGLAIKLPLGTWALVFVATIRAMIPRQRMPLQVDETMLIVPFLAIFILVSSQTGINAHFRYVIPALPFLFVWASKAAIAPARTPSASDPPSRCTPLENGAENRTTVAPKARFPFHLWWLTTIGFTCWSILSSLWYFPHGLSYFNELIGGPTHGHEHMLGSSVDWGQDLLHLNRWYVENPDKRPFYFASHATIAPWLVGLDMKTIVAPVPSDNELVDATGTSLFSRIQPGWYAIDVWFLHKDDPPNSSSEDSVSSLSFSFFNRLKPVTRVGYSIWIFHIPTKSGDAPTSPIEVVPGDK